MTPFDHLLAFAFMIGFPVYFLVATPVTRKAIEAGDVARREKDYWLTLVELWVQGLAVLGLWVVTGRPWWELGFWAPSGWKFFVLLLLFLAFLAVVVLQVRAVRDNAAAREQIRERMAYLEFFMPHSRRELRLFSALSVSAGVFEEIAYRGFLMWYLLGYADRLGSWLGDGSIAAVILSSLGFGFAHLYLGWGDAIRSGLTGAVLAGIYIFSGSLWLPIAFHALIDLNSGFLSWFAFQDERADPARFSRDATAWPK